MPIKLEKKGDSHKIDLNKSSNSQPLTVHVNRPFCSAALIKNIGSQAIILKEEKYFTGHQEADQSYGFGFSWTAGSK